MWVKICANTSLEDAHMAVRSGADAVGFVFAPSRRQVTPKQVATITAGLLVTVETVGVYSTDNVDQIVTTHCLAKLHTIQLHGSFDLGLVNELQAQLPGAGIIQSISWSVDPGANDARDVARQLDQLAPGTRVLLDSKVGNASGGTGMAFDWKAAQTVLARYPELKFVLAGGLTPENVAEAIETLHPWGVDVASGVEAEPGRKDPRRTLDFVRNAKSLPPVSRRLPNQKI